MNRPQPSRTLMRCLARVLVALPICLFLPAAQAADIYISAEFKPDIGNPDQRQFVNTTPWSGVCAGTHLPSCIASNWWSIDTKIRGTKQGDGRSGYGRGSFYIGMPPPRIVRVTSEDGAHSFDLTFRIIGAAMRLRDTDGDGPTEPASTGGARNCTFGLRNTNSHNRTIMRMLLRRDGGEGSVACGLDWITANNYDMNQFDITYSLTTPAPLSMRSGLYTGQTTFRVGGTGEGADFDLGDGVVLDDSVVNIHFSLEVRHAFQLDLAPGSDRAVLMPRGGWTQWSDHGIAPKALEKELPFQISSSGRFSVSLTCEHVFPDGRCALRNQTVAADDVPLDIRLTMPGFHRLGAGEEAVLVPLTSIMTAPVFAADLFVIRRPSRLDFAVNGAPVLRMLDHPGSHYRGDVTVIFDADP